MQQRLDHLSAGAGEVVRVAAVLPDRFSAGLLAAMLDRQPASLMAAVQEAVRADLLVEDGEQLRFRHDLLREATRNSLPQSLRRAMERQSASIMLRMGAAPAEVATQLARSAEPGDREAIDALRQAAQSVGHTDAGAAAELSRRALELLPADDPEHGLLVAETVELLNRASRYPEAEELAVAALSEAASPQEEAEIRLRLPTLNKHSAQRRVEENRRALQLGDISEVTRARHLAWLAYNLALHDPRGQQRAAADEAVEAAASSGDLEATIVADVALACVDSGDGYVGRALRRHEELYARTRMSDATAARELAAPHYAHLLAAVGRVGRRGRPGRRRQSASPPGTQRDRAQHVGRLWRAGALGCGPVICGAGGGRVPAAFPPDWHHRGGPAAPGDSGRGGGARRRCRGRRHRTRAHGPRWRSC
jgi:hypothetical protein